VCHIQVQSIILHYLRVRQKTLRTPLGERSYSKLSSWVNIYGHNLVNVENLFGCEQKDFFAIILKSYKLYEGYRRSLGLWTQLTQCLERVLM